jgi:GDP-L-fucose synthase
MYSLVGKRVWVAGHRGLVGSALLQRLRSEECELLAVQRAELDLRNQAAVESWMEKHRPQVIVVAAAKVGGILANMSYPVDFLYDNLMIEQNIIHAAHRLDCEKLLLLGSSCIYPKHAPQPINEDSLLTGPLEPTNEWYALAKIAGVKLCAAYRQQYGRDFISAMPTNLYGFNDNFDLLSSHVLPALLHKMHVAKMEGKDEVEIWGTGEPLREFLHVTDLVDALVFLLKAYSAPEPINVGSGRELSISELASLIAKVVGYEGRFVFDPSKPDGTPRKLLDSRRLAALGWVAKIELEDGIAEVYDWFRNHQF